MVPGLSLAFEQVHRGGPTVALELDVPLEPASVTVLFGPSGAGKTTVLRVAAGLERPVRGRVALGDEVWLDTASGRWVPPSRRPVGMVFQDYALFPHLSVAENLAFGLSDLPRGARRQRVEEVAAMLGLDGLTARRPGELSGGQQQRVALGRALARQPRLLLLDEPLSALDAPTRGALRGELGRWLKDLGIPALLVTHDREEALALGDRLVLLHQGRVRQCGTPAEVFTRPAEPELASLLGIGTVVPVRVGIRERGLVQVTANGQGLWAPDPGGLGAEAIACIPAEGVGLEGAGSAASSVRNRVAGRVAALEPRGALVRVEVDCGFALEVLVTAWAAEELDLRPGSPVTALVKAAAIHLIPRG